MRRQIYAVAMTSFGVHTHNDRGTCTAATELALLAGAERVEGTLFGNGERTGNCDITTGVKPLHAWDTPNLDLNDLNEMENIYKRCTGMEIPPRIMLVNWYYCTAAHQDAIKKAWQKLIAALGCALLNH